MSGLSIFSALVLLGGTAFAAFTTTATANGSTFSSSTPSMQLCNDNGGTLGACANQIPNPINVGGLIPGTPKTFAFWISNTGTDTLNPLAITFTSPSISGVNTLEADLNVSLACDATGNNGSVSADTFNSWESGKTVSGGQLGAGTQTRCVMTVELPAGNTTDAGQTLNFNASFDGSIGL